MPITANQELTAPLALNGGGFAMLALDQRESLRRMFPIVDGSEVADDQLRAFKKEAMRTLTPHASAVLLDRPYAVERDRPSEIADGCALILAVDVLEQPPLRGVIGTSLDPEVTVEFVDHVGADALKLLVIWRPGPGLEERTALIREFVVLAEQAGVASLLEGIAKPEVGDAWATDEDRQEGILAAAAEMASSGATIYKGEVPGYAPGDVSLVREHAERMTRLMPMPWVILSNGTDAADFAEATKQACLGGAAGFLAGRAIWADAVAEDDPAKALRTRSTERLRTLADIVSTAGAEYGGVNGSVGIAGSDEGAKDGPR